MTIKSFSRQLASFIEYSSIVKSIVELKANRPKATEKSVLLLGSNVLTSANDWDLYHLIRDFLSEFKIPQESLSLIVKTEFSSVLDNSIIEYLTSYRFTGKLEGDPKLQARPADLKFNPLISIVAESWILDILYNPVSFLISVVESYSRVWEKARQSKIRAYLEPSSASELLIYIEKRISNRYEFLEKSEAGEKAGNSVFFGYRYVCLTSEISVSSKLVSVAKLLSNHQAQSTLS